MSLPLRYERNVPYFFAPVFLLYDLRGVLAVDLDLLLEFLLADLGADFLDVDVLDVDVLDA